jgi:hypothetical protein
MVMPSPPQQPLLTIPLIYARTLNRALRGALYVAVQAVIDAGVEPQISVERLPVSCSRRSKWTLSVLGGETPVVFVIPADDGVAILAAGNIWIAALTEDLRSELRELVDAATVDRALADFVPPWPGCRGSGESS